MCNNDKEGMRVWQQIKKKENKLFEQDPFIVKNKEDKLKIRSRVSLKNGTHNGINLSQKSYIS